MSHDRRTFLKATATTAAALALPAAADARAVTPPSAGATPKETERRLQRARPVPLDRVRLTGGPLLAAQQVTAKYLLALEPDRMLAYYRTRAGLAARAEPYTGWDGDGKNLTGHIAGHHLSGVSLMYEATGDRRFLDRANYIVQELDLVQQANRDGYLGAIGGLREAFAAVSTGDIRAASFDLNGLWSPWYTLHKTFAGLRDAYRHAGNARALQLEVGFAAWAEGVLAPMDDAQVQRMLNTEFGGMNEVLVDLYADTGEARWLALSRRFEHHAVIDPMRRHQDNLTGKHGNCQIPKLIGSAGRYGYTGDADDLIAASFFWDRVVRHHSYATGGHGLNEYFGQPDHLAARVDGRAAETCNVYNMLKLTRRLFAFRPDASYADFHERALFNHILASMDPSDGRMSYMVPVGRAEQQEYQDMQRDFTCCVGSGMESHALHAHGVWYESDDTVWLNQFVPSSARTTVKGARMDLTTSFPDGDSATIRVTLPAPATFTLMVRRPWWAGDGFTIAVNGTPLPQPPLASLTDLVAGGRAGGPGNESTEPSSSYVRITRQWRVGDLVTLSLPKALRLEPTPDDPTVSAIMWGPLALAADHGPRHPDTDNSAQTTPASVVPMLVSDTRAPEALLEPVTPTGDFRTRGVTRVPFATGAAAALTLAPFHRTHGKRYAVYFDVVTPAQYDARVAAMTAAREAEAAVLAATVGFVVLGDTASESAASYRSDPDTRPVARSEGRTQRNGAGWMSFTLPVSATKPTELVATYFVEPGLPAPLGPFDITGDGTLVAHYAPDHARAGFYRVRYPLPDAITRGKATVTFRLEAASGGKIAPVFELRTIAP
ncbi:MAG: glycoside hydrolase family 127 protein [Gemmatimonadaceae bacterium]|nr:glycoside hydrolase family 127 protein [Gemmatimonadaceae bacterium]